MEKVGIGEGNARRMGRRVGSHTRDGVRADLMELLDSEAAVSYPGRRERKLRARARHVLREAACFRGGDAIPG